MNPTKKWLIVIAAVVAVALVASIAAVNPQTPPAATGVTATNTANGVRVSWNDDAAAVHRVGWGSVSDFTKASEAGDVLEAFHFADTKRQNDYILKHLPQGQEYLFMVGTGNQRFGPVTWSGIKRLTVNTDSDSTPTATPTPTTDPSLGTKRSNPIPYGQKFQAGVFDMQIAAVDTDAWPEIRAENQFNDPPASGYRFVMWTIKVENARGSTDETEWISDSAFKLVGSRGVKYQTYREENRCGIIPNELADSLYRGGSTEGNVCFAVPTDETGLTFLYDTYHDDADGESFKVEVWFHALPYVTSTPAPTSTPVPDATTAPAATSTPAPTSTPVPTASCSGDDYDRDEWGSYPRVPAGATATWTLPSDNVNNTSLTHDHHVALKDAHVSGGCNWTASRKDAFSSDLDNLNPTTGSFNSSKGSRTPDRLTGIAARIINTNAEKCDYATQHEAVKDEYSLSMTTSERTTVNNWLALCSN